MNTKNKKTFIPFIFLFSYSVFLFPCISFAAPFEGVNALLTGFGGLIKLAIPIAYAFAILFFFYGIAKFILHAGDEKAVKEGKSIMIYGVIAIFVISSYMGIVKFIGTTLGIDVPAASTTGAVKK